MPDGSYTPTPWADDDGSGTAGTPINAARLNNIEDGIGALYDGRASASVAQLRVASSSVLMVGALAGGDLTGTYPNPTLASAVAARIDGIEDEVDVLMVASAGALLTGAVASGVLSGTYPNPGLSSAVAANALAGTNLTASGGRIHAGDSLQVGSKASGVLSGTYPSPGLSSGVTAAALAGTNMTVAAQKLTPGANVMIHTTTTASGALSGKYAYPGISSAVVANALAGTNVQASGQKLHIQPNIRLASVTALGPLDVRGSGSVLGALDVGGVLTAASGWIDGPMDVEGTLTAASAYVEGPVGVGGEMTAASAWIDGRLGVDGSLLGSYGYLSGDLDVGGKITAASAWIDGPVTLTGLLTAASGSIGGPLDVNQRVRAGSVTLGSTVLGSAAIEFGSPADLNVRRASAGALAVSGSVKADTYLDRGGLEVKAVAYTSTVSAREYRPPASVEKLGWTFFATDQAVQYVCDGSKWVRIGSPAGSYLHFASGATPEGYLLCNGQSYPRYTDPYQELYAAIGTKYGAEDSSHFNTPLVGERVLVNADGGSIFDVGTASGAALQTMSIGEMPSHQHIYTAAMWAPPGASKNAAGGSQYDFSVGLTWATGGSQPHNNMQPSFGAMLYIKL